MDTKMSGIVAPGHKLGASLLPKSGQQSLASRVLGGAVTSNGNMGGTHMLGESRKLSDGRGNRSVGDDTELGRKIIATHHGGEERGIAMRPVLQVIDVIFNRAGSDIPGFMQGALTQSELIAADEKVLHSAASLQDMVELPSRVISAISCEINCKCTTGVDLHTIVMEVLQIIKHYNWDSKAVLTLVSLAIIFGEFRLEVQLYPTNPLAKAIALLKQLPEVLEHAAALKPKLDTLFDLIAEIIDVTKKVVEFYDIPRHEYFTDESPEILAAVTHIPTAVYWTIRSIVVASTQILALTGMGIEYLTEPWELSSLAHKLGNIKAHLVSIISSCYRSIEKRKEDEIYQTLEWNFTTTHIDNHRPMVSLFSYRDGQPALYDCSTRKTVSTEDLRRKIVAFFITDVDPELARGPEYAIIQQMYGEKRHSGSRAESNYEVVWVPISDFWTDEKHRLFESLREPMDWHSVHHPSVVSPVVSRYIKDKWGFNKKPMLVVMDTQGRIVHNNAIHMMCIWGSLAYPFTTTREKSLWEEMSWNIELVADNLDQNMGLWLQDGRHICLYGGEDIDWIRKFTRAAKEAARDTGIVMELLYVGKSKAKERTMKLIIDTIQKENLSRTLDWNLIWYFWLRLESMWHSKGHLATTTHGGIGSGLGTAATTHGGIGSGLGTNATTHGSFSGGLGTAANTHGGIGSGLGTAATTHGSFGSGLGTAATTHGSFGGGLGTAAKIDTIMQGIIAMLSYGSSEQGWGLVGRGTTEVVKGSGDHMFRGLSEHARWTPRAVEIGFIPALDEYLKKIILDTPHHCTRLILPSTNNMPDTVSCSECGRLMERFTMFRCCLD